MNHNADYADPVTYEGVMEMVHPLDGAQLYALLCHIAYRDPALVAAALESSVAA